MATSSVETRAARNWVFGFCDVFQLGAGVRMLGVCGAMPCRGKKSLYLESGVSHSALRSPLQCEV